MVRRDLAVLVLCGFLLLLPAIFLVDRFNPDEPREAEISREMWESGDLVVPHFDGCPFLDKPALFYCTVRLTSRIQALPAEAAGRLPSVLAAIGLLAVAYFIGLELYDRRTARAAALLLLTTFQFWWLARRVMLDMTLALFVGAAMLCFLKGERTPVPVQRFRWLLLGGAACAGAVMSKGLIGLLI